LAAPITPLHGILVCRGTPVGNHWSRGYDEKMPTNVKKEFKKLEKVFIQN